MNTNDSNGAEQTSAHRSAPVVADASLIQIAGEAVQSLNIAAAATGVDVAMPDIPAPAIDIAMPNIAAVAVDVAVPDIPAPAIDIAMPNIAAVAVDVAVPGPTVASITDNPATVNRVTTNADIPAMTVPDTGDFAVPGTVVPSSDALTAAPMPGINPSDTQPAPMSSTETGQGDNTHTAAPAAAAPGGAAPATPAAPVAAGTPVVPFAPVAPMHGNGDGNGGNAQGTQAITGTARPSAPPPLRDAPPNYRVREAKDYADFWSYPLEIPEPGVAYQQLSIAKDCYRKNARKETVLVKLYWVFVGAQGSFQALPIANSTLTGLDADTLPEPPTRVEDGRRGYYELGPVRLKWSHELPTFRPSREPVPLVPKRSADEPLASPAEKRPRTIPAKETSNMGVPRQLGTTSSTSDVGGSAESQE
ncbi:hypothetical protein CKM354_001206700 [Cercospora kikuchii]|uniref:Uncharacterized protein n=1 Tax=Cercospora kikuchii TaxID=84275 RepID=A0A9P3CUX9_9PEZI|nr:uncharacterized protein CKM354_001206700 [Cercospora kikuchii]GIZ49026.1 hypothetical protein CKM354_001206700 [Cercospora kikuchii]